MVKKEEPPKPEEKKADPPKPEVKKEEPPKPAAPKPAEKPAAPKPVRITFTIERSGVLMLVGRCPETTSRTSCSKDAGNEDYAGRHARSSTQAGSSKAGSRATEG